VNERIYGALPEELIEIIHAIDDARERVMIFGHNPEMTSLAHQFSREIDDMPTCAIAEFTFDVNRWREVGDATPTRFVFSTPKTPDD